ncbi:uncharacterized protein Triagg1_10989 [Trichoderma aggressivum f. europaeum]|uniref:Uncharacterized protein n=1 Tax=Trichoderma aggressivum f. europaeum TaxID=173218 RepID=A0AAE1LZ68_9HYPO|nr:hypothetical protein Triagg1_10989 [Trichoderma aggressivum f. europaeum]
MEDESYSVLAGVPRLVDHWCLRHAVAITRGNPASLPSQRCADAEDGVRFPDKCQYCASVGGLCISLFSLSSLGAHYPPLVIKLINVITWATTSDRLPNPVSPELVQLGLLHSRHDAVGQIQLLLTRTDIPMPIADILNPAEPPSNDEPSDHEEQMPRMLCGEGQDELGYAGVPDLDPRGFYRLSSFLPDGYESDDSRITWDSESGMPINKRGD